MQSLIGQLRSVVVNEDTTIGDTVYRTELDGQDVRIVVTASSK